MKFTGYVAKRIDNGLYWNKTSKMWEKFPTVYEQKRFASCAGSTHTEKENRVAVKVEITIDEVE